MIDDIAIFWNFANREDIRRKCNPMIDFLKFTSNKKILNGLVALSYNQVCCQTLFYKNIWTKKKKKKKNSWGPNAKNVC